MVTIKISTELLQATLNYLASKPYAEVAGLVGELQRQANDATLQSEVAEVNNAD